jgi:integrase
MQPTLGKHRGVYVAVYYDKGRRSRRSLGTSNKAEAVRRLANLIQTEAFLDQQSSKTIEDVFKLYVLNKQQKGKATERVLFAWKNLSGAFGGLLPHHITDDRVHDWTTARSEYATPGTIRVELGYLRAALRWAAGKKLIPEPVSIALPPPPRPKTDYITRTEFKSLLESAVYPHVKLFLILAIATGGRSSAILDLTWDRVDFEKRTISLDDLDKSKSSKGRATVPMNKTAFAALSTAKKGATSNYVIEWGGLPVKRMRHAFAVLSKRTGLKVTPHMLRHSAAVWMAEGGVPMSEISQYLGHTNTGITERVYARFSPGYLQKAASVLDL